MASGKDANDRQVMMMNSMEAEIDSMPLVDEDAAADADVDQDKDKDKDADDRKNNGQSVKQVLESSCIGSSNGDTTTTSSGGMKCEILPHETVIESMPSSGIGSPSVGPGSLDSDEIEEKERLIQQVLELQNTLSDLSLRVDSVKEENLKLRSENQVLGQYIENLMSASNVFQSTSPTKLSPGKKSSSTSSSASGKK